MRAGVKAKPILNKTPKPNAEPAIDKEGTGKLKGKDNKISSIRTVNSTS
jgi:hypothetical protein